MSCVLECLPWESMKKKNLCVLEFLFWDNVEKNLDFFVKSARISVLREYKFFLEISIF